MSPHNWIHLFLFFCHQHAALHGGLFKICSKLQPYLRTYQSKDVKDLKNYFHPQTLFGGLDLEGKIDVHTTQLEWIWQFSCFEVFGSDRSPRRGNVVNRSPPPYVRRSPPPSVTFLNFFSTTSWRWWSEEVGGGDQSKQEVVIRASRRWWSE